MSTPHVARVPVAYFRRRDVARLSPDATLALYSAFVAADERGQFLAEAVMRPGPASLVVELAKVARYHLRELTDAGLVRFVAESALYEIVGYADLFGEGEP